MPTCCGQRTRRTQTAGRPEDIGALLAAQSEYNQARLKTDSRPNGQGLIYCSAMETGTDAIHAALSCTDAVPLTPSAGTRADAAYLILLDQSGVVRWRYNGLFDEDAYRTFSRQVSALAGMSSPPGRLTGVHDQPVTSALSEELRTCSRRRFSSARARSRRDFAPTTETPLCAANSSMDSSLR